MSDTERTEPPPTRRGAPDSDRPPAGPAREHNHRRFRRSAAREPAGRWRLARLLLPAPTSERHGIAVLLLGFVVEGATELFQFLDRGSIGVGPVVYYSTIATTVIGFYLMFLGFREWHVFRPKPIRRRTIPWPLIQLFATAAVSIGLWVGLRSRRVRRNYLLAWLGGLLAALLVLVISTHMVERPRPRRPTRPGRWLGPAMFGGGTAATAALGSIFGGGLVGGTPIWAMALVGGLIVLAFGNFFFGLRATAAIHGASVSAALGWTGFGWSLAVATVAGVVVGDRALLLLTEFFTNWSALIASIAPVVVAMSPLFVSYGLMIGAFVPSLRRRPAYAPPGGLDRRLGVPGRRQAGAPRSGSTPAE